VERRLYFVVGDLVACVGSGALAGWGGDALVTPSWNPLLAMLAGMTLGMLLTLMVDFACFLPLFGSLEVMLPSMLSGMLAGMATGMAVAMGHDLAASRVIATGGTIGAGVFVATYAADVLIRRGGRSWTN